MKLTKAKLKEIILEELAEMYVTDIAGSDEDRAVDQMRRDKRARGEYPARHGEASPQGDFDRSQAMAQTVIMILKMNPVANLSVDANTYSAVEKMAPDMLDRLNVSRGME